MNQPSSSPKAHRPKSKPEKVSGTSLRDLFSDSRRKDPRPRPRLDTSKTFESEASETHAFEALETFKSEAPTSKIPEFKDQGFEFV